MKRIEPFHDRATVLAQVVPAQTESYTPVSCQLIFKTVDQLVKEMNLTIIKEEFLLHGNGQKQRLRFFFGVPNSEFVRELVIINSYDKSIALRAASGVTVIVCSNGTILGDIKIYRKHTGTVDEEVENFLRDCFVNMLEIYQYAQETKDRYSNVHVDANDIGTILGRLFYEYGYLSSSQLNIVKNQFENPSFDYGVDENSLWAFYQHLTYALTREPANDYLENRRGIQEVIANFYQNTTFIDTLNYEEYSDYEEVN